MYIRYDTYDTMSMLTIIVYGYHYIKKQEILTMKHNRFDINYLYLYNDFMKIKIILSILFANFLFAIYFIINAKSGMAIAAQTTPETEQKIVKNEQDSIPVARVQAEPIVRTAQAREHEKICYKFTTNELNSDITSIANAVQTKIKEEKKYNIYWGLSANKEEAIAKYKELQAKVFDGKNMDLVYISQQYSLLVGRADNDIDALKQVRDMSAKTSSIGGRWFYGSYVVPTYEVKFNALADDAHTQKLQKLYHLNRCN